MWVGGVCTSMKEEVVSLLERIFKNELDQWPHEFMWDREVLLFTLPLVAGLIKNGIVGGLIFGAPFIIMILIQRFRPM